MLKVPITLGWLLFLYKLNMKKPDYKNENAIRCHSWFFRGDENQCTRSIKRALGGLALVRSMTSISVTEKTKAFSGWNRRMFGNFYCTTPSLFSNVASKIKTRRANWWRISWVAALLSVRCQGSVWTCCICALRIQRSCMIQHLALPALAFGMTIENAVAFSRIPVDASPEGLHRNRVW